MIWVWIGGRGSDVVGGAEVGGRCQGDRRGGCRRNKETLRVRAGGMETGWTGCDKQRAGRLKIEML